jgi:glycosyltransferase involved in cell wall biosynthesis
MVRVLNDMGYAVDVIECTNKRFIPMRDYDLFIGHQAYNFGRIARSLPAGAVKIFFATGISWQEWNRREADRFLGLKKRRGVRLPYDRRYVHNEDAVYRSVEGIICLGNEYARNSFASYPAVFALNNAAFDDDYFDRVSKDRAISRKGFLFFSGPGNVHKGLDLLLEAFDCVDAELYICQHIEEKFGKVYHRELFGKQNIHTIGCISPRSQKFYELVERCDFAILPSCAEGSPGSVIECMHRGLIPVVTEACNIHVNGFGVLLDASSVEAIAETVRSLIQRPTAWIEMMSRRTRQVAMTEYSESNFINNMRTAVEGIISKCAQRQKGQALQDGVVSEF